MLAAGAADAVALFAVDASRPAEPLNGQIDTTDASGRCRPVTLQRATEALPTGVSDAVMQRVHEQRWDLIDTYGVGRRWTTELRTKMR